MRKYKKAAAILSAGLLMSFSGCSAEVIIPEETTVTESEPPITSLRPQDDFYGYVNLDKLNSMEIEHGSVTAGSFDETTEIVDEQLDAIIKDIVSGSESYPRGSSEQLIKSYYELVYNYSGPSESSEEIFSKVFAEIDNVKTIPEFTALMGKIYKDYGVSLLLSPTVNMNIYDSDEYAMAVVGITRCGLTDFKELKKTPFESKRLTTFTKSILKVKGLDEESAEKRAEEMTRCMIKISQSIDFSIYEDASLLMNYSEVRADEYSTLFSSFDFEEYLRSCGATVIPDKIYINDRSHLEKTNELLKEENLTALKDYAIIAFASEYGEFLPEEYTAIRQHYFRNNVYDLEKFTRDAVKMTLDYELGQLYAEKHYSEETVSAAMEMCEKIRTAYASLIQDADWLTQETKDLLCRKLSNIEFRVGLNRKSQTDTEIVDGDLFLTKVGMNSADVRAGFSNIGKKYDPLTGIMSPQIVNASYNTDNTVTIPLAILNKPFFEATSPEAENLGALGAVIAHEISHAFDSDCVNFDADGNYNPEWICEADRLLFEEKMKEVSEYYSRYTVMDVYHVDGELTLGENFADLGGVECVIGITETPEEKRMLLEAYADIWCSLENDQYALELLREDVHSPAVVRVNAVVASCDDFYELYDVNEGDGMYVAPEDRVSRW